MQHVHSLPLVLFILFDIAYIIVTLLLYARIFRSIRDKRYNHMNPITKGSARFTIIVVTLVSIYMMTRWIVTQITLGCTNITFWNPTCYDLNHFNRSWLVAFVLIAINGIVAALMFDLWRQNRQR